jgi:hypothetical protein
MAGVRKPLTTPAIGDRVVTVRYAPIPAIRRTAIEPPESTHTGHSLAMMPDVYPPIAFFVSFPPMVPEGVDAEVRERGAP